MLNKTLSQATVAWWDYSSTFRIISEGRKIETRCQLEQYINRTNWKRHRTQARERPQRRAGGRFRNGFDLKNFLSRQKKRKRDSIFQGCGLKQERELMRGREKIDIYICYSSMTYNL